MYIIVLFVKNVYNCPVKAVFLWKERKINMKNKIITFFISLGIPISSLGMANNCTGFVGIVN